MFPVARLMRWCSGADIKQKNFADREIEKLPVLKKIEKISKIFKSLLDKQKIGDILSNCHSDESALIEN